MMVSRQCEEILRHRRSRSSIQRCSVGSEHYTLRPLESKGSWSPVISSLRSVRSPGWEHSSLEKFNQMWEWDVNVNWRTSPVPHLQIGTTKFEMFINCGHCLPVKFVCRCINNLCVVNCLIIAAAFQHSPCANGRNVCISSSQSILLWMYAITFGVMTSPLPRVD